MVDQALSTLTSWLKDLLGLFLGIFALIEGFCRTILTQLGIPAGIQAIVIVVIAVVFILGCLRLFGGIIRILLIVFLALLVVHILLPNLG